MANFTSEIRKDLLRNLPVKRCCRLSLLAAFLDTSGDYSFGKIGIRDEISFTSENESVAEFILVIIEKLFGISMTVTEAVRDPKHNRNKLTFSYFGAGAGEIADEISDYSASQLEKECCMHSYIQGAFLGSGSCTLPRGGAKTGYHLEFVFKSEYDAVDFCDLLEKLQLLGNVVFRADKYVVYCKNRESISDFLSVVEAKTAQRIFEEISAVREENNNDNRVSNCIASNTDRAYAASATQILMFESLEREGILATLPTPLQEVATARTKNPMLSLSELAESLQITKSCLNHRIRKLAQIYTDRKKS